MPILRPYGYLSIIGVYARASSRPNKDSSSHLWLSGLWSKNLQVSGGPTSARSGSVQRLQLILDGDLNFDWLPTAKFEYAQAQEAYASLQQGRPGKHMLYTEPAA